MAKKEIHTTKDKESNKWVNKAANSNEILSRHENKQNAIERGRKLAIQVQAEHVIHNLDGKIGMKNTYAENDPNPPKDQNGKKKK